MIRITGGFLKGKTLADHDEWVRPTSAYRREMIFNILRHRYFTTDDFLENARVVDVFAGTGALGLEALSRGAPYVTFVEKNTKTAALLKAFIVKHTLEENASLLPYAVQDIPQASQPAQLLFLDPPYGKNFIPQTLQTLHDKGWIAPDAILVTEADTKEEVLFPPWIDVALKRTQGRTNVFFLAPV